MLRCSTHIDGKYLNEGDKYAFIKEFLAHLDRYYVHLLESVRFITIDELVENVDRYNKTLIDADDKSEDDIDHYEDDLYNIYANVLEFIMWSLEIQCEIDFYNKKLMND